MVADDQASQSANQPVEEQAQGQTGRQQVRMRVDEREMRTNYANAFRTNGTAEEVMIDFGVNAVSPVAQQDAQRAQAEVVLKINDRIIMNYYSAKRLAMMLGQLVRRHEEQFGELEMDVSKRGKDGKGG